MENILFIGGCPRSGTTALLQIFNSNPFCYISSEENILEFLSILEKKLNTKLRRKNNLRSGMRHLSARESLTLENIHSHNFDIDSVWPTLKFIYKFHHEKLHPGGELTLWGDKLPNYYSDIAKFLHHEIKYIHITRNPFDVINSMISRCKAAELGKDWWRSITNFDDMLNKWCDAYASILEIGESKKVLHIQYEDLIFQYDNTVSSINSFLNLNLIYSNILINDPNLHFKREFIEEEMIDKILSRPQVVHYFQNCCSKYSPKGGH